jgi:hypothetical protein
MGKSGAILNQKFNGVKFQKGRIAKMESQFHKNEAIKLAEKMVEDQTWFATTPESEGGLEDDLKSKLKTYSVSVDEVKVGTFQMVEYADHCEMNDELNAISGAWDVRYLPGDQYEFGDNDTCHGWLAIRIPGEDEYTVSIDMED